MTPCQPSNERMRSPTVAVIGSDPGSSAVGSAPHPSASSSPSNLKSMMSPRDPNNDLSKHFDAACVIDNAIQALVLDADAVGHPPASSEESAVRAMSTAAAPAPPGSPSNPHPLQLSSLSKRTKSVSMVEMSELVEMVEFSTALDDLAKDAVSSPSSAQNVVAVDASSSAAGDNAGNADNGDDNYDMFLMDDFSETSRESSGSGGLMGGFLGGLSMGKPKDKSKSKNDSINAPSNTEPPVDSNESSIQARIGMKRSMSMASIPSRLVQDFCTNIHTISEEGPVVHLDTKRPDTSTRSARITNTEEPEGPLEQINEEQFAAPPFRRSSTGSSMSDKITQGQFATKSLARRSSVGSASGRAPLRSSLKSSLKRESSFNTLDSSTSSMHNNDQDLTSSPNPRKMKYNVSFSSLEIRSYNVTLGDQPSTSGPPVSLDWEYDPASTATYDVDTYESRKEPSRSRQEMFMSASHRQYLLMREVGFSRGDIRSAIVEAQRIHKQREKTIKRGYLMPVEEKLEKTKKLFGRLAGKSSADNTMKKL